MVNSRLGIFFGIPMSEHDENTPVPQDAESQTKRDLVFLFGRVIGSGALLAALGPEKYLEIGLGVAGVWSALSLADMAVTTVFYKVWQEKNPHDSIQGHIINDDYTVHEYLKFEQSPLLTQKDGELYWRNYLAVAVLMNIPNAFIPLNGAYLCFGRTKIILDDNLLSYLAIRNED
jgi:hypothetical protein